MKVFLIFGLLISLGLSNTEGLALDSENVFSQLVKIVQPHRYIIMKRYPFYSATVQFKLKLFL